MGNPWNVWTLLVTFAAVAYLVVLLRVVVDLFRDTTLAAFARVLWLLALVLVPLPAALVYVVVRGPSMARRQEAACEQARAQAEAYIRWVAGPTSPVDQIASGRRLLEAGVIDHEEFAQLKAKALSLA